MFDHHLSASEAARAEQAATEVRDGLHALAELLTGQPRGALIDCQRVGALVRLLGAEARVAAPPVDVG